MITLTLLLDSALALATAVVYGVVGRTMSRRPVSSPEARQARAAFVVWWQGLAVYTTIQAALSALGAFGILDRGIHAALTYLSIVPLVACLWGLLYYLVFIYTGTRRFYQPLIVAHVAVALFFFLLVVWMHPVRVATTDWSVVISYEHELEGWLLGLVLALILVPVLVAAVAYFTLIFRVRDPQTRLRIALVSGAFLFWFGTAGIASATALATWYWWPLVARGIAIVATLVLLAAYRPPRAWQGKLGRPN